MFIMVNLIAMNTYRKIFGHLPAFHGFYADGFKCITKFDQLLVVVELAAMRSAVKKLGGDPKIIEPLVPVDLVVDHSVQVDFFGSTKALQLNLDMEFKRNRER